MVVNHPGAGNQSWVLCSQNHWVVSPARSILLSNLSSVVQKNPPELHWNAGNIRKPREMINSKNVETWSHVPRLALNSLCRRLSTCDLPSLSPQCWDYRCAPSWVAYFTLQMEPRASCLPAFYLLNDIPPSSLLLTYTGSHFHLFSDNHYETNLLFQYTVE